EALLALLQLLLHALLLGHVLARAGEADRRAAGVAEHLPAPEQRAHRAVGAHDAVLERERAAVRHRLPQHRVGRGAVVGVHGLQIAVEPRAEVARRGAEDAAEFVGPDDVVALDVPFPAADVADALRLGQARLAAPQLLFDATVRRDVIARHDRRRLAV